MSQPDLSPSSTSPSPQPTVPGAPDPTAVLLQMSDLLRPNAIRAAAALQVVDHIDAGAVRPDELADRTGTRPDMMVRLLRYLVTLGVVTEQDGRFAVGPLGEPLRTGHPSGAGRFLSAEGLFGRLDLGLVGLLETIRTGRRSYEAAFGRGYWHDINTDPAFRPALVREGAARIGWDAELIVGDYDWSAARSVLDVGGNNGTLLIELLSRHRHLNGTVLDLANLAELAQERIAAAGLDDRARAVTGDFFAPLPTGHDVYLISGILADWDDEDAVAILTRCADAARPTGGRVLLAEINLDATALSPDPAAMDLTLAATMPAPLRTVDDLRALGEKAGLTVTWQGPVTPVRSLLEFAPADPSLARPDPIH